MDQIAALHWIQENIQDFGGDKVWCVALLHESTVLRGAGQRHGDGARDGGRLPPLPHDLRRASAR